MPARRGPQIAPHHAGEPEVTDLRNPHPDVCRPGRGKARTFGWSLWTALLLTLAAPHAEAHCDAMDGPLIPEAMAALESGDLTPVLKWIPADQEALIATEFDRARRLRDRDAEVREVADRLFLETLLRVHREAEGAPFTGIKPAGSIDPLYQRADAALDEDSVDALTLQLQAALAGELRSRFETARALRAHADDSVPDGRHYIAAYVEYMHFVEGLGRTIHGGSGHGTESGTAEHPAH